MRCSRPFAQAISKALEAGLIPDSVKTMAGTWGTVSDQGDLTYLNMCHLYLNGTDPDALTHGEMAGRKQAMHAIAALQAFMPGCEEAKLRNFDDFGHSRYAQN